MKIIIQFILYLLAFIFPKKNKWVFGCMRGFSDGAAELSKYISRNHNDIEIIWLYECNITREIIENNSKIKFVYLKSIEGYYHALTAKVSVYCIGFSEIGGFAVHRSFVVNLWHGVPLKKIYLDVQSNSLFGVLGRIIKLYIASIIDLIPVSSIEHQKRMMSAFNKNINDVPIIGEPRTDRIARNEAEKFHFYNEKKNKNWILYAPTWRDGQSGIPEIDSDDLRKLNHILKVNDMVLFIRPHPLDAYNPMEVLYGDNIVFFDSNLYADLNIYLCNFDAVITDYSSVAIDFCIKNSPVLFFSSDIENYKAYRGFYENYEKFSNGGYCRSWSEIIIELPTIFSQNSKSLAASTALKNQYHPIVNDKSSINVYDYISKKINKMK